MTDTEKDSRDLWVCLRCTYCQMNYVQAGQTVEGVMRGLLAKRNCSRSINSFHALTLVYVTVREEACEGCEECR